MRGGCALTVWTFAALLPLHAWAQKYDPALAEELFQQGRAAAEGGRYKEACPKFAESFRQDPTPGTLLNVGDCEEHLGHIAKAWRSYKRAIDLLPPKDGRVAIARSKAKALEKRLPRLTIRVAGKAPSTTTVKRDGVEITVAELGKPTPVDPGEHIVAVAAPGRQERTYVVQVDERQTRDIETEPGPEVPAAAVAPVPAPVVAPPAKKSEEPLPATPLKRELVLDELPAPAPSATATTAPAPATAPASTAMDQGTGGAGQVQRTIGYTLGGVGLVGLGLGAVFGLQRNSKLSDRDAVCGAEFNCTTDDQPGRIQELTDDARRSATLATVSFVVGGVALAGGVVLVLTSPGREKTSGASASTLWIGANGPSAVVGGAF
jgi:hypothetical protein